MNDRSHGTLTALLILGTVLFFLRVVGQIIVALYGPSWLPPMAHWYSGLVPYPLLLPIQILILMLMPLMIYDFALQAGAFHVERPSIRARFTRFSIVYFLAMIARYVVTMALHPERRWLVGAIPIALHLVLASFIFIWAQGTKSPSCQETHAIR